MCSMMFDMLLIWAKYRHAILYSSKKTQKRSGMASFNMLPIFQNLRRIGKIWYFLPKNISNEPSDNACLHPTPVANMSNDCASHTYQVFPCFPIPTMVGLGGNEKLQER